MEEPGVCVAYFFLILLYEIMSTTILMYKYAKEVGVENAQRRFAEEALIPDKISMAHKQI